MRTPLLAALAALVFPACLAGEITGVGGDDVGGPGCGDSMLDSTTEQCDDGNTLSGDGCSASCQTEDSTVPRVTLSVDKPSVTSDLNVDSTVTITATSAAGFSGDVTLAVTALKADLSTANDWSTVLAQTTLSVPLDGAASTTVTLSALGNTTALAGSLKVTATGPATPGEASVAVTFNPVLVVTIADSGAGECVYPVNHGVNNPWRITSGRDIKVVNGSTTLGLVVHTGNAITGFPHESGLTAAGGAYQRTVTGAGVQDIFYCHNPNDGTAIIEGGASGVRNYLRVE